MKWRWTACSGSRIPTSIDIPRLVGLLRKVAPGRHRDEVEKTIMLVCDKLPAGADRAGPVLAALAKVPAAETPKYLPLLGRLGGAKALQVVEAALGQADPEVKQAAVRALCNWPDADGGRQAVGTGQPRRRPGDRGDRHCGPTSGW